MRFHSALQERQESQLKSPRGAEVNDGSPGVMDGGVDTNGVQGYGVHPDASGSVGTEDGEAGHSERLVQVSKVKELYPAGSFDRLLKNNLKIESHTTLFVYAHIHNGSGAMLGSTS